jgi:NAD(P)-dependent dehydrogenase (short-subunit alcohol dehydrogenase family)
MGKVALITGGSSGIGRETALAFAERGSPVVVADINSEAGHAVVDQIRGMGGNAEFIKTDVTLAAQVEAMVAFTVDAFGSLDYAFNNAGIATQNFVPIAEFSEAEWDRIIAIDLKSVWLCLKYECRQMLKQGGGAIVNTSSIMGKVSRPNHSAYSAAKAGVIGLTQSVAMDYAALGIRVNAICPGGIHTPMTSDAAMVARLTSATPMSRMGQPREISDAVLWLCSDQSSFVTGQALAVDGGYTVC